MSELWTADQKHADWEYFPTDMERDWRALSIDEILRWSGKPAKSVAEYSPLTGPLSSRSDERDRAWMIVWEDI